MYFNLLPYFVLLGQFNFLLADPTVQLPNGFISGREDVTLENKTYFAFYGIPYAAPPVGELRFKAPQPALDWEGTRDGTKMDTICYQRNGHNENESEDCLFINVATPQLPSEDNNVSLPVMLWIHGGGFVGGSGMDVGPDLFINNDVILVSVNYRLGIFGFLSTQDTVIPGNNGLKDQQFAIQWTHDNIHLFGGDSNRITIFGQSAGSASCAYQLLNQKNNGLFQGAILESGSFLSPWAFQRDARQIAFRTAFFLNSSFEHNNDSQALLEFLLTVDAKDLSTVVDQYAEIYNNPYPTEITQGFLFAPVIEEKNPDAFLTKRMYGLLEAGNVVRVPILIGITSEEFVNQDPESFKKAVPNYDHVTSLAPKDMQLSAINDLVIVGRLIQQLYTGNELFSENLGSAIRYFSDTAFTRSVIKHGELFSKLADTYFYIFSYDGLLGNCNITYEGAEKVSHTEELAYLFCSGNGCDFSKYPEGDAVTSQRLIKLWTNFAKYQNPTPEPSKLLQNVTWPAVSTYDDDYFYLNIDEDLEIKNHPKEDTYAGWVRIYEEFGPLLMDTY